MRTVLIVTFVLGFLLGLAYGPGGRGPDPARQADAPASRPAAPSAI